MSSSRPAVPQAVSEEIPPVPLTIEGYSVLHQMMKIRWVAWRQLPAGEKTAIAAEAANVLIGDGRKFRRASPRCFPDRTQGRPDVHSLSPIV